MTGDRALAALKMSTGRRIPGEGLTHSSDQGSEDMDGTYQALLKGHGCQLNINGRDAWQDSALLESVFGMPNGELVHQRVSCTGDMRGLRG
jgi:putative transposase